MPPRSDPTTLVVAAHRRPKSLSRLLTCMASADVRAGTHLIISIDRGPSESDDVAELASAFVWPHGSLTVLDHDRLGLVGHFMACGGLTSEHGPVVYLEDDLLVGPGFQNFATAALGASCDDPRVAGVSLTAPFFDGFRHLPFEPVATGSDGFYMQVPWYDGMAWTPQMWDRFLHHDSSESTVALHPAFDGLGADEWFGAAMRYLVDTDRYYLFPYESQATNSGAPGTHFDAETSYFQTPLALGTRPDWCFDPLDRSSAIYDDHMELTGTALRRLAPALDEAGCQNVTVDLGGTKQHDRLGSDLVLTTRPAHRSIQTFGASLHPLIANVVMGIEGSEITLARVSDIDISDAGSAHALDTLTRHATRGRTAGLRASLRGVRTALEHRVRPS